jgi:hypothetical protein
MMDAIKALLRQGVALFVDDGSLAIAILITIAVAAWASFRFEDGSATATILVVGCVAILVENVVRAMRRSPARP